MSVELKIANVELMIDGVDLVGFGGMAEASVGQDLDSADGSVYQYSWDAAAVRFSDEHRTVAVMLDVDRGKSAGGVFELL